MKSQRKADDRMVRDIKSLHLITKKALLNLTKKTNDKIETKEKAGFHNFKSNSLNLFVSDHSDYPTGYSKQTKQPKTTSSKLFLSNFI